MKMLSVDNVSYRYKKGDRDVLDKVCCAFESGELSAIVGPSGSGKTTLLSILAGLDRPHSGSVCIEDANLEDMDLDRYRRERISMIFQAYHLFPLLTALENVCYPMQINGASTGEASARARELLNSVYITEDKFRRYPSNLSGGEQQRVAIARALSSGARVLLADEPTGNLDADNGAAVIDIFKRLAHEEGYCIIIVTHSLEIANASDTVFHMKDGVLTL